MAQSTVAFEDEKSEGNIVIDTPVLKVGELVVLDLVFHIYSIGLKAG